MTTTLYRPVGLKELQLIIESNYKKFPPRLEWQPIFYPVLNQKYAEQIANKWNRGDEASGYCGIVLKFNLPTEYLSKYEVQNVGGFIHNELWIPAEELDEFNKQIIGQIIPTTVFIGDKFDFSATDCATSVVNQLLKTDKNEFSQNSEVNT